MSHEVRPSANQPNEAMREIYLAPKEMQAIAEAAKGCIDTALEHDWAVVSDRSIYSGIPHHNGMRSGDFRLALRDTAFSSLDIDVPRKDEDVRIRITAHAMDTPHRTVVFEEFAHRNENGQRSFFVNDSHALAMARSGRPVDSYMSQSEVAIWLYQQSRMTADESRKRAQSETDPVLNAADLLSPKAKKYFTVRQVKVALSPDLELHGQVVEAHDPRNPLSLPMARKYTAWVNNHHTVDDHPVTERLFVEFSPDDQWIASDLSPMSRASVMIESPHPTYNLAQVATRQAVDYEDGGILDTFQIIQKRLGGLYHASAQ